MFFPVVIHEIMTFTIVCTNNLQQHYKPKQYTYKNTAHLYQSMLNFPTYKRYILKNTTFQNYIIRNLSQITEFNKNWYKQGRISCTSYNYV